MEPSSPRLALRTAKCASCCCCCLLVLTEEEEDADGAILSVGEDDDDDDDGCCWCGFPTKELLLLSVSVGAGVIIIISVCIIQRSNLLHQTPYLRLTVELLVAQLVQISLQLQGVRLHPFAVVPFAKQCQLLHGLLVHLVANLFERHLLFFRLAFHQTRDIGVVIPNGLCGSLAVLR